MPFRSPGACIEATEKFVFATTAPDLPARAAPMLSVQ
jgi:hypothetical protein